MTTTFAFEGSVALTPDTGVSQVVSFADPEKNSAFTTREGSHVSPFSIMWIHLNFPNPIVPINGDLNHIMISNLEVPF